MINITVRYDTHSLFLQSHDMILIPSADLKLYTFILWTLNVIKVVSDLRFVGGFVNVNNNTNYHDIAEMLKVSEWLLFNTTMSDISTIPWRQHVTFDEIMMMSA